MVENLYKEALEAAQKELSELLTKRAEMDARIARLRETVVSLAYLVNNEGQTESLDVSEMGITDAVAKVLRLSGMALTPADIRDELARMGFDIKKYSDIIPSITKVLHRLSEKGHVDVGVSGKGERKVYIWSPMQPSTYISGECSKCSGTGWEWVTDGQSQGVRACSCRKDRSTTATKRIIDPYSGKGSVLPQTDVIIANPPYAKRKDTGIRPRRKKR